MSNIVVIEHAYRDIKYTVDCTYLILICMNCIVYNMLYKTYPFIIVNIYLILPCLCFSWPSIIISSTINKEEFLLTTLI